MTDRTIRTVQDLEAIDFSKLGGLIPVIAQDVDSRAVLMVAFANRDALVATLESGQAYFWSRSRAELWRKGETSGNTLAVSSLHMDCDADTILALVSPAGPTCHTGEATCFGTTEESPAPPEAESPGRSAMVGDGVLARLDATLSSRSKNRTEGSYTVRLLEDTNLRLKKLGEESAELVAALATGNGAQAVEEAADLLYHILVGLRAEGLGVGALLAELDKRAK